MNNNDNNNYNNQKEISILNQRLDFKLKLRKTKLKDEFTYQTKLKKQYIDFNRNIPFDIQDLKISNKLLLDFDFNIEFIRKLSNSSNMTNMTNMTNNDNNNSCFISNSSLIIFYNFINDFLVDVNSSKDDVCFILSKILIILDKYSSDDDRFNILVGFIDNSKFTDIIISLFVNLNYSTDNNNTIKDVFYNKFLLTIISILINLIFYSSHFNKLLLFSSLLRKDLLMKLNELLDCELNNDNNNNSDDDDESDGNQDIEEIIDTNKTNININKGNSKIINDELIESILLFLSNMLGEKDLRIHQIILTPQSKSFTKSNNKTISYNTDNPDNSYDLYDKILEILHLSYLTNEMINFSLCFIKNALCNNLKLEIFNTNSYHSTDINNVVSEYNIKSDSCKVVFSNNDSKSNQNDNNSNFSYLIRFGSHQITELIKVSSVFLISSNNAQIFNNCLNCLMLISERKENSYLEYSSESVSNNNLLISPYLQFIKSGIFNNIYTSQKIIINSQSTITTLELINNLVQLQKIFVINWNSNNNNNNNKNDDNSSFQLLTQTDYNPIITEQLFQFLVVVLNKYIHNIEIKKLLTTITLSAIEIINDNSKNNTSILESGLFSLLNSFLFDKMHNIREVGLNCLTLLSNNIDFSITLKELGMYSAIILYLNNNSLVSCLNCCFLCFSIIRNLVVFNKQDMLTGMDKIFRNCSIAVESVNLGFNESYNSTGNTNFDFVIEFKSKLLKLLKSNGIIDSSCI